MARVGSFGRLPRGAPDLNREIVAMLREVAAAEDRAIYDAWQNGGEYKGEAVTDARLLTHVTERRDALATNDPLYDRWSNEVIQLDFKIGEEKAILAYNEGKATAQSVVAFYRGKLQSIPRDSQFYREVAGRAAQWAKSTVAAGRAAAKARLNTLQEDRLSGAQAIQRRADDLEYYIAYAAAREYGFEGDITEMDASNLTDLLASGRVLDGNGRVVSMGDWQTAQAASYSAFNTLIDASEKLDRSTLTLRRDHREYLERIQRVNAVDNRVQYEMAENMLESDFEFCKGNPSCEIRAFQGFESSLNQITVNAEAEHGGDTNWALFIGGMKNTVKALNGQPTDATTDALTQQLGALPAADLFVQKQSSAFNQEGLRSGRLVWGQKGFGEPLSLLAMPRSPMTGQPVRDPSQQESIITVGGEPVVALLAGMPVYANGLMSPDNKQQAPAGAYVDPQQALAQGFQNATDNPETIGYIFYDAIGKQRFFGIVDPATDKIVYTRRNPFSDGLTMSEDGTSAVLYLANGTLDPNAANAEDSTKLYWNRPADWASQAYTGDVFDAATGGLRRGSTLNVMVDRKVPASQVFDLAKAAAASGNLPQSDAYQAIGEQLRQQQQHANIVRQEVIGQGKAPARDAEQGRLAQFATQEIRQSVANLRQKEVDAPRTPSVDMINRPKPSAPPLAPPTAPAAPRPVPTIPPDMFLIPPRTAPPPPPPVAVATSLADRRAGDVAVSAPPPRSRRS